MATRMTSWRLNDDGSIAPIGEQLDTLGDIPRMIVVAAHLDDAAERLITTDPSLAQYLSI